MSGGPLEPTPRPPAPSAGQEPPADATRRDMQWASDTRDTTPAVGSPGAPASWRPAVEGADVALAREDFGDAQWSYLFGADTDYAGVEPADGQVRAANRRARLGTDTPPVQGPVIKPAVWTWEIPVYFWTGGIASGSAFVALACDLSGDHRSARIARVVSLAALAPSPLLLISDLGRPERFVNMLRVFKPRSPMNLGAWALTAFGAVGAAAVAGDLAGRPRVARGAGALNAAIGGYLGSYTGVLLASTSVPVWSRSRVLLGPIFVATAAATGAAACRLVLVACGLPDGHPTRRALGTLETTAMGTELVLSIVNARRLGPTGRHLEHGRAGVLFSAAKWAVRAGLALRLVRAPAGPRAHHLASALYLGAGLAFRWAWIEAGRGSAHDHEGVARTHRANVQEEDWLRRRLARRRPSSRRPARASRAAERYAEAARRLSLRVERVLRR